jgi:hypothetical protein
MDEIYKGHVIESLGMPDAGTHRWWPLLTVLCPPEPNRTRLFKKPIVKKTFRTEISAESEGVAFAKKWIDDGKPEPNHVRLIMRDGIRIA